MSEQNICNICGANYVYEGGRLKCPACGVYKLEHCTSEEHILLCTASAELRKSDFAEAEKAYEDIIKKYPENPDGYWGRLFARFGIKFEEDPDGTQVPTCYATIESIITDRDYIKALSLADAERAAYYKKQA